MRRKPKGRMVALGHSRGTAALLALFPVTGWIGVDKTYAGLNGAFLLQLLALVSVAGAPFSIAYSLASSLFLALSVFAPSMDSAVRLLYPKAVWSPVTGRDRILAATVITIYCSLLAITVPRGMETYRGGTELSEVLPRVLMICLPERRTNAVRRLGAYGIDPQVVPAVPKETLPSTDELIRDGVITRRWAERIAARSYNPGRLACELSHRKALRIVAASDEPALVLEDDVTIWAGRVPRASQQIKAFLEEKDYTEWDGLYLGRCHAECSLEDTCVSDGIVVAARSLCRHAIIWTPDGARKYLRLSERPMDEQGDQALSYSGLRLLALVPSLFYQDTSSYGSTLGNDGGTFNASLLGRIYKRRLAGAEDQGSIGGPRWGKQECAPPFGTSLKRSRYIANGLHRALWGLAASILGIALVWLMISLIVATA